MFRNDAQLARVCELLCLSVHKPGMWRELGGGAAEATELCIALKEKGAPWSHGEKLMFQVAWALWNGSVSPDFGELVNVLDGKRLRLVGSLLLAIAGDVAGIDDWLARTEAALQ